MKLSNYRDSLSKFEQVELKEIEEYIELEKSKFTEELKNKFDSLWTFYCNNFNEIKEINYEIHYCNNETLHLKKEFEKFTLMTICIFVVLSFLNYFLNAVKYDNSPILLAVMLVGFKSSNTDIKINNEILQIKMLEKTIHSIRKNLSVKGIRKVKYENEFVRKEQKWLDYPTEKNEFEYSKYKELHYTNVIYELIKNITESETKNIN